MVFASGEIIEIVQNTEGLPIMKDCRKAEQIHTHIHTHAQSRSEQSGFIIHIYLIFQSINGGNSLPAIQTSGRSLVFKVMKHICVYVAGFFQTDSVARQWIYCGFIALKYVWIELTVPCSVPKCHFFWTKSNDISTSSAELVVPCSVML